MNRTPKRKRRERTSRMNWVSRRSAALISSPEGRICAGGRRKPVRVFTEASRLPVSRGVLYVEQGRGVAHVPKMPPSRNSVANDHRILATASTQ